MKKNDETKAKRLDELVSLIERDLMFQIIWNIKKGTLSLGEAQKLAQDFLVTLPTTSRQRLFKKLSVVARDYAAARIVFLSYATPYEERRRRRTLYRIRQAMKQNVRMKGGEAL